ncbi:oxidoreductase [Curtobacterium flaccumfaciens]|uniref:oxidoreductase n=1 Tax=Curtobacterium flaccumfaciens TaxID=2035 RepID=UPI003879221E
MSIWFITGASRGFGSEIVRAALDRGDSVVATARDPQRIREAVGEHDELLTVALDVTDPTQAEAAARAAVERFGRIDVLVNNAGRGLVGGVEEASDAEVRALFDVNVHGVLTVLRAVLPVMREQRSGRVINISSSGGFVARAGWGVYSATKFAVEALSESLRREAAPLGIQVTAVEPGGFRTDFLDGSSLTAAEHTLPDYAATVHETRKWAEQTNHSQPGDPKKAAKVIADLIDVDELPERLQLGQDCFDLVGEKLRLVEHERDLWRSVSVSTALDN